MLFRNQIFFKQVFFLQRKQKGPSPILLKLKLYINAAYISVKSLLSVLDWFVIVMPHDIIIWRNYNIVDWNQSGFRLVWSNLGKIIRQMRTMLQSLALGILFACLCCDAKSIKRKKRKSYLYYTHTPDSIPMIIISSLLEFCVWFTYLHTKINHRELNVSQSLVE